MKKLIFLGASVLMLGLSSCSVSKTSIAKSVSPKVTPIMTEPRFALYDVDFDNRITGTASGKRNKNEETTDMFAFEAMNKALVKSQADFLYEPTIIVDNQGNNIHVIVSGYPARYTGFKPVDLSDSLEVTVFFNLINQKNTIVKEAGGYDGKKRKLKK